MHVLTQVHNTHVCIHTCVHTHAHRPDCKKKAYVRLAPDYDALDVANKVSLCFILCKYSQVV